MKTNNLIKAITILVLFPIIIYGQTHEENLEKYWRYRETLKTHFMYFCNNAENYPGSHLTAETSAVNHTDFLMANVTPWIRWGDATFHHGHYLGVLALEYRLLRNNGQDVTNIINEIEQALDTYERLDEVAELNQNPSGSPSFNGFFARDDVSTYMQANFPEYILKSDWIDKPGDENVISQDQVWGLFLGFSLLNKLVNDSDIPASQIIHSRVVTMVDQIINRMHTDGGGSGIPSMIDKHWRIVNPVTDETVPAGGGFAEVSPNCWAFAEAAGKITGDNEHYAYSGYQQFEDLFDLVQNNYDLIWNGISFPLIVMIPVLLPSGIFFYVPYTFNIVFDESQYSAYGIAILSMLANDPGGGESNVYDWLVRIYNDYAYYYDGLPGVFPHLPAISYVLNGYNGNEFLPESFYKQAYLDKAEECGSYHYAESPDGDIHSQYPWHTLSLFSPWHNDGEYNFGGHYNNIDYMLLYTAYFMNYFNNPLPYRWISNIAQNESVSAARKIDAVCQPWDGYTNWISAGQEIHLKNGFHAHQGSEVIINIDPGLNHPIYFEELQMEPCDYWTPTSSDSYLADESGSVLKIKYSKQNKLDTKYEKSSNSILNDHYQHDILIYPNPSKKFIYVKADKEMDHFELRSISGQVIKKGDMDDKITKINLSNLKSGFYFLYLMDNSQTIVFKFSKTN